MAGRGDEDLSAEVVAYKAVFAHGHVGEARAVDLMVDAVEVVRTGNDGLVNIVELERGKRVRCRIPHTCARPYAQSQVSGLESDPERQLL